MTVPPTEQQVDDTSEIWRGRPAWSSFILLWIFVAILAIRGVFFIWIVSWASALFHAVPILLLTAIAVGLRQTALYRITRRAVYRPKGFTGNQEHCISLSSIASASERKGPLDRLFGTGDVILHLKDGTSEHLAGIKEPEIVSRKIMAMI
jgi:membrane protein YdbS with pleckstrin-like domain